MFRKNYDRLLREGKIKVSSSKKDVMTYIANEEAELAEVTEPSKQQEFTKIVLKTEGGLVRPVASNKPAINLI